MEHYDHRVFIYSECFEIDSYNNMCEWYSVGFGGISRDLRLDIGRLWLITTYSQVTITTVFSCRLIFKCSLH